MKPSVLVLGLGNPLLGDEGVGLRALELLARGGSFPAHVELVDGGTAGLRLVPLVSNARKLLILDAIRAGNPPGTVMRIEGGSLPAKLAARMSPHEVGLADVLAAARLRGSLQEIVILGVEPETTSLGLGLSAPVAVSVEKLVAAARRQIQCWEEESQPCTSSR